MKTRLNDHRRIAWRLSGKITGEMIGGFIILDIVIVLLLAIFLMYPDAISKGVMPGLENSNGNASPFFRAIGYSIENLFSSHISVLWPMIPIGIVEALVIIGSSIKLRGEIKMQLEPLRELRVAADAFAEAAADAEQVAFGRRILNPLQARKSIDANAEALRRMAEALKRVDVRDMDAHITAESVAPELRPLLEAISEMLNRLEAAYEAQAKFVSDASHELRTPIAVIQGYANLLSRWGSEDPETLHESIEAIRSEAEAMKQMVNQLLFLARGDNETLNLNAEKTDLVPIIEEVLSEELMIDDQHEIESRVTDEHIFVLADPALIKQLLRILADNSVKYTPEGGGIVLSAKVDQEAGLAFVIVQDEGAGISAELLPHIFDRFVRADESRTRNTGGSGLGLAIAKQIVDLHGGTLDVFSIEGAGSRFTVTLPLAAD